MTEPHHHRQSSGHHGHSHQHAHHGAAHAGHHHHAPVDFGRAFLAGIALNTGFVAVEAIYGFLSHSMALLADAGHNLSDVLGLIVAWAAFAFGRRAPSPRYSYGLRNSTVLAALINAVLLMLAIGAIAWEAVLRLGAPQPVQTGTMIAVAAIGIVVNGTTALLFMKGGKTDLNIRGAYLHMAADAGVSLGVVIAGLLIMLTGFSWIDPLTSLVIAAVIAAGTWGLLRDSLAASMAAVPPHINTDEVRGFLCECDGVASVHDLHIWPLGTANVALTAHLVMPEGGGDDALLRELAEELHDHFGIDHATLQIERNGEACPLAPAHVV